jgi:hypothetical protein
MMIAHLLFIFYWLKPTNLLLLKVEESRLLLENFFPELLLLLLPPPPPPPLPSLSRSVKTFAGDLLAV